MQRNEAGREFHDFRCRLTTCNGQELRATTTTRAPHACTEYIEKDGERERAVLSCLTEIETKGKSFAHLTSIRRSSAIEYRRFERKRQKTKQAWSASMPNSGGSAQRLSRRRQVPNYLGHPLS